MTLPATTQRVAVVGAGWAGLAAAVRATEQGHVVTLFEMARTAGGRARTVDWHGEALDNGQHILIGAYVRTLALMRSVGVEPENVLLRRPLALVTPDGRGLRLPPGAAVPAFVRGMLGHRAWRLTERLALLVRAASWALQGFRCDARWTVARLCQGLPTAVRTELVDPLCVAALNTSADEASAAVFLRVLRDALFSGPGAADLLLPRRPLGELLPEAALRWLSAQGADVHLGTRIGRLRPAGTGWSLDGEAFDHVVLACSAIEAGRLVEAHKPAWAQLAQALRYEPIVTVTVACPGARLVSPMVSLPHGPAQFAFDHGAISNAPGRFAFVISGAQSWIDAGLPAAQAAVLEQMRSEFPQGTWPVEPEVRATLAERRATFRCTPGLQRPPRAIAPGLVAAGDYVEGAYPATLEGAVRSGEWAIDQISHDHHPPGRPEGRSNLP